MDKDLFNEEINDEAFVYNEKSCPLSEIITVQSIVCVAVSIIFVLINIFYPQTAAEIYDVTSENFNYEVHISAIAENIKDFLNSSPSDRLQNVTV